MTVIGIFAPGHERRISQLIRDFFRQFGKRTVLLGKGREEELFELLQKTELDAAIVLLHPGRLPKIYFDILIMELSHPVYQPELAKRLHGETRLIYNEDAFFSPVQHPYAISYGMRYDAAATASSIDSSCGMTVTYCLQRSVRMLSGEMAEVGEVLIHLSDPMEKSLSDLLAAVTCGILCGVIQKPSVKI